jgi:hypothetical protein
VFTGNVSSQYFVGNGYFLTGVSVGSNYSNVNVAAYTQTQGFSNYSNINVAAYLPTYTGNIANIRLGVSGILTFADGTTQTTASTVSLANLHAVALSF